MDNKIIFSLIFGFILGLLLYNFLLIPKPQTITKIVETIETKVDTVFVEVEKIIPKTEIRHRLVRDTVYLGVDMPINDFRTSYSHVYGNIYVSGEVMGEVLSMGIKTHLKLPTITNTVTKEKTSTIVKQPSGFYITSGINNDFHINAGAVYLKNNSLIGYDYQFNQQIHSIKVGWKVF